MPPTNNEQNTNPYPLAPDPQSSTPLPPKPETIQQPQSPYLPPYQQPTSPLPGQPQTQSASQLNTPAHDTYKTAPITSPPQPNQPFAQAYGPPQSGPLTSGQSVFGQVPTSPLGSNSPQYNEVPRKYKVFRSFKDTFRALKSNLLTFVVSTILAVGVATILLIIIFVPFLGTLKGLSTNNLSSSIPKLIGIIFLGFILFVLWETVAYAFMLSVMSKALNSGADGNKSSIFGTVKDGLRVTIRVALVNLLVYVATVLPSLLIVLMAFLITAIGFKSPAVFVIAGLLSLAWFILAILRFLLAPYIAIFEPNTRIRSALGRSNHLMRKGGQWFFIKMVLFFIVIELILSIIAGRSAGMNTAKNIILILVSVLVNGSFVMLYRNRKIVRDQVTS